MNGLTNVLIRIRGATKDAPTRYPVEAQIDGSGLWKGESEFDFTKLDVGAQTKQQYGSELARQLLNPSVTRALEQAGLGRHGAVRLRLLVDDDLSTPHWIRWERMYLHVGGTDWPIAIAPETPFSRCIPDERADADPPEDDIFRLLFVIANPSDLKESQRIDVNAEVDSLVDAFTQALPAARCAVRLMPGLSGLSGAMREKVLAARWALDDGPSSLDNISRSLHREGGYHALHLVCHGNFQPQPPPGLGFLYLEGEDGKIAPAKDYELQSWIHPKLQLVVFQACRTAAAVPEGEPPFSGIAPRVVKSGVPAVVAMQDFVLMTDARAFSAAFYRALLRDGTVDRAVNEGRQSISQAADRVESTIPALFMRLRNGQLWRPDPVREDVWSTSRDLGEEPEPLPLKIVQDRRGLLYDPSQPPEGSLFKLESRLEELLDREKTWFICLTGPPGFDKTTELHRQYGRLAKAYLDGESNVAPFLVTFSDLDAWAAETSVPTSPDLRSAMRAVASRQAMPPALAGRRFLFLVKSSEDLPNQEQQEALDSLGCLLERFPGSRTLVACDDRDLRGVLDWLAANTPRTNGDHANGDASSGAGAVSVLIVQPLDWADLRQYLCARGDRDLAVAIQDGQLTGIASVPWMFERLRDLASRERFPVNRAEALSLIASSRLGAFDSRRAPRSCAEVALSRIAWQLQTSRTTNLDTDRLIRILEDVRERRDFRLSELTDELVRCGFLTTTGDDSVRFTYPALRTYFAARYLHESSRRIALLEDVTATLGRFSRMRHWEDVLITLAGLQDNTADRVRLLQTMVAGSSLAEGEQAFLAACLYVEMVDGGASSNGHTSRQVDAAVTNDKVVHQILDTLVWRLGDRLRPYAERRLSAQRLADMRHPRAIEHLVKLAVDTIGPREIPEPNRHVPDAESAAPGARPSAAASVRYELSGIRMIAVNGLLSQHQATEDYVQQHRPGFLPVIAAWREMVDGKLEAMTKILNDNTPNLSPVAAFALAQAGMERGGPPLVAMFKRGGDPSDPNRPDLDLLWAIAEVFGNQDARWLHDTVIDPLVSGGQWRADKRVCYLVQKSAYAPEGSEVRKYVYRCLESLEFYAQDRALRALAKLSDPAINDWLKPLCHDVVRSFDGDWTAVLGSPHIHLHEPPRDCNAWSLTQAALEVLRDIGDGESMDIIRDARFRLDATLAQLSFQVSEEIYWRLSGGLWNETFAQERRSKAGDRRR